MKPNPTMSRGGMAYHAAGIARGEIASLFARLKGLIECGIFHAPSSISEPEKDSRKSVVPRLGQIGQMDRTRD
jgi:hypothetical protein